MQVPYVLRFALAAAIALGATPALAQTTSDQPAATEPADKSPLKQEELDQLVASIALYPDPVVSQILMASTYPLEVVEASQWLKKNPSLKGDALGKALEEQTWDPSVKSLVNFPDVLNMMSDQMSWTTKLGDAFLAQQEQVMARIQALRAKAKEAGHLKSDEHQKVEVEQQGSSEVIVIEPSQPEVIYVPQYNPTTVYGAWPAPAYPPYYYPPPGYVATAAVSWGLGVAAGAAWGYAWGHANWGHGHLDVDVNRNANFNRNIDRSRYSSRTTSGGRGTWQHNPAHRGGAGYANRSVSDRYRSPGAQSAARSREQFRGHAAQGQRDISAGRVDRSQMQGRTPGASQRSGARPTPAAGARRTSAPSSTGASRGSRGAAFENANRGGNAARASSARGSSSRAQASRGGGGSRGGYRGGGGGSRGGGGRGGGGRR